MECLRKVLCVLQHESDVHDSFWKVKNWVHMIAFKVFVYLNQSLYNELSMKIGTMFCRNQLKIQHASLTFDCLKFVFLQWAYVFYAVRK